jgi:[acyl-carrier-protein] S-malonyltransferase
VCAGALSLVDAARVVRLRGQFMQEAVAPGVGGMAAILGLERAEVEAACAEASSELPGETVQAANLNGGGQVVIAGHKRAVEKACEAARRRGARRAMPLAVSAPFHSALMQPAADRLREALGAIEVRDPRVPVVTNVEATANSDGRRIRDLLTAQVTAPVRWEESMLALAGLEIAEAVEVGHGSVLAGLAKRIVPGLPVYPAADPGSIASLKETHGQGADAHG